MKVNFLAIWHLYKVKNFVQGEQGEDYANDEDCTSEDDDFDAKDATVTSRNAERASANGVGVGGADDDANPFGKKKKKKKRQKLETGLWREILKFK